MSLLHTLHPERIHLLWAVLALAGLLTYLERRSDRALSAFVAEPMLARLMRRPARSSRALRILLIFATACLGTMALMRPLSRSGTEVTQAREEGAGIMIVLDVSRSMLAEDAAPNRLERAKAELRDLIRELKDHKLGLIAFAGRASVLCPLTPDHGFLRLVLDQVSPGSVNRGGTRIGDAIRKALDGLGDGSGAKAIVLVTDGEDHESYPLEAAKQARERGVRIISIGFGDERGSEIILTDPKTLERGPLRDRSGAIVRSRLSGEALREIALATEGAYVPAGTGVLDLESIVRAHVLPLIRASGVAKTRIVRAERYQGFLCAALLSLVLSAAIGVRLTR